MFGCKNFGYYLMLYLKTDVILLADVFEKCRRIFDQVYGLNPCHYYSAPNISWNAMLKTTKVKLDLLSDIDMLLFCERAIRGGLNGIGEKRYMKANNEYLQYFDEEKPSTYGLFLDFSSNLHDCHSDSPLAAEKLKIEAEMLSQYQIELGNKTSHIPKLLETLQSKQNNACHY